jgi:hypothetical protein
VKLSSSLYGNNRNGKATEVLWSLQKLAADLEAEMDKMYAVGGRGLVVDISISTTGLCATLRGEA